MNSGKSSNPCIRCGKERVVTSVLKEYINGSLVTTTQTSCPDPLCQKKLDEMLEREKVDREKLAYRQYPFRGGRVAKKAN